MLTSPIHAGTDEFAGKYAGSGLLILCFVLNDVMRDRGEGY